MPDNTQAISDVTELLNSGIKRTTVDGTTTEFVDPTDLRKLKQELIAADDTGDLDKLVRPTAFKIRLQGGG